MEPLAYVKFDNAFMNMFATWSIVEFILFYDVTKSLFLDKWNLTSICFMYLWYFDYCSNWIEFQLLNTRWRRISCGYFRFAISYFIHYDFLNDNACGNILRFYLQLWFLVGNFSKQLDHYLETKWKQIVTFYHEHYQYNYRHNYKLWEHLNVDLEFKT